jgi:hypothetical protein
MEVHCPHCHTPVDLVDDSPLSDIGCPSCGSSFSLLSNDETLAYEGASKTIGHFDLMEQIGAGGRSQSSGRLGARNWTVPSPSGFLPRGSWTHRSPRSPKKPNTPRHRFRSDEAVYVNPLLKGAGWPSARI